MGGFKWETKMTWNGENWKDGDDYFETGVSQLWTFLSRTLLLG